MPKSRKRGKSISQAVLLISPSLSVSHQPLLHCNHWQFQGPDFHLGFCIVLTVLIGFHVLFMSGFRLLNWHELCSWKNITEVCISVLQRNRTYMYVLLLYNIYIPVIYVCSVIYVYLLYMLYIIYNVIYYIYIVHIQRERDFIIRNLFKQLWKLKLVKSKVWRPLFPSWNLRAGSFCRTGADVPVQRPSDSRSWCSSGTPSCAPLLQKY